MKEVKYIPGDLINSDDSIVKVISIAPALGNNIELGFSNGWCYTGDYRDFDDEALGVPLTTEILEKNGWREINILVDEDGSEHHLYENKKNLVNIMYVPECKRFLPFIGNQHILTSFKYVHQLQHLLFGLGLPMDLKV